MSRPPRRQSDPLVRDLQTIRQLSWSRPKGFERLEVLLEHPLVLEIAGSSDDLDSRVDALRAVLKQGVVRLRRKGAAGPLVADAAAALLRLKPRFERMTIADIRKAIASTWPRGGKLEQDVFISAEGFRRYVEDPQVLKPLAHELRELEPAAPGANGEATELENVEQRIAELLKMKSTEGLGRVAMRTWATERAAHCERLNRIVVEGYFRIRDDPEMFELLDLMIGVTRREIQAVDHIELARWEADPRLGRYLESQFERARRAQIPLTRIRLVNDAELEDTQARRLLLRFIDRHETANVTLLLCRADAVDFLKTSFIPRTGLFLIDPHDDPAAVIGWGGGGPSDQTELHMRETERLCAARREFDLLRRHALEHCDQDLRSRAGLRPSTR